jgi:hypothetical protein
MRPSCYTVPGLGDGCVCRQATAGHQGWLLLGRYREIRAALEGVTARLFAGFPPEDLATAGRVLSIITTRANAELADPELSWAGRGYPHDRTQAAGDQLRLLDRPAD